jgi:hypothetical protein
MFYNYSLITQLKAGTHDKICIIRLVMVLMEMCNPQIDNFDWIKMKGQLRLVLRIEHCSILNTVS